MKIVKVYKRGGEHINPNGFTVFIVPAFRKAV